MKSRQPSVLFDRVLVVALHEQRPDRDREVVTNLERSIRSYRERLVRVSGRIPQELYRPVDCLLWGDYDNALFFLADDLEAIMNASNICNASSQEFLFGSPYIPSEGEATCRKTIGRLFRTGKSQSQPLVAISRIKIGDHLLAAAGATIASALALSIYAEAAANEITAIVLRCWAWPEIVVIFLADDPLRLFRTIESTEQLSVGHLLDNHGELRGALHSSVAHDIGYFLIRRWIYGRENEERSSPRTHTGDALISSLRERHVVVAARTQFGFLGSGWPQARMLLQDFLPARAAQAAFQLGKKSQLGMPGVDQTQAMLAELGQGYSLLPAAPNGEKLLARITVQAKPGHRDVTLAFAVLLSEALGNSTTARVGNFGQTSAVLLRLELPATVAGLAMLLCVSHSFRVCTFVRPHILNVTTHLEWPPATVATRAWAKNLLEREKAKVGKFPSGSGYANLLSSVTTKSLVFERAVTTSQKIGRVEALALHNWYSAISQITTRPEMFGAMSEVQRAASTVYRELIARANRDLSTDRKSEYRDAYFVAQAVTELGPYFQLAYQQRLQFSPAVSGAPPINGQLPYGVNQIVRMVDGLSAAIMQAGFLLDPRTAENPDIPARTSLVIFAAEPAIATRAVLDFGLLQMSLLQAFSPLSLCVLFHELGHQIIRQSFWERAQGTGSYRDFIAGRIRWGDARSSVAAAALRRLSGNPVTANSAVFGIRVATFLEDSFSHAVWLRIGCRNDFDIFCGQFLSAQAMGLRTAIDLRQPHAAWDVWAQTLAHLVLQKCFHDSDGPPALGWRRVKEIMVSPESIDPMLHCIMPFCIGELRYSVRCTGAKTLTLRDAKEALLDNFYSGWGLILASLAAILETDAPTPSATVSTFPERMAELWSILARIESFLAEREVKLRSECHAFNTLAASVARGLPVTDVPWSVVSPGLGGCPTSDAVLWAREALRGVAVHFENSRGDRKCYTVDRDSEMNFTGVSDGGPLEGVFADFIGGIFVCGAKARQDYLGVRLAAIETLSALATRLHAGPMSLQFLRSRRYLRNAHHGFLGRVRFSIDGGSSFLVYDVEVLDQSPVSAAIQFRVDLDLRKLVKLEAFDYRNRWRRCSVVRNDSLRPRFLVIALSARPKGAQRAEADPLGRIDWMRRIEDASG